MTTVFPSRTVPLAKITEYLLNPAHEVGAAKQAFFYAFGFSAGQADVMRIALITHPDRNPVETTTVNEWGTTYVVRCSIATPDGRDPCIRSVWIVPSGTNAARLVTAYPA